MNKRRIKIVKQGHEAVAGTDPVDPAPRRRRVQQDENDMSNTVKNWIAERRENSIAEQGASAAQVFAWASEPDAAP